MIGVWKRGTRSDGQRRRAALCPDLEALEGRLLLYAANGGSWTYSDRITYSFAPDGTDVGGQPNVLNQAMAARGITTAQWKTAIRDAAALWEAMADLNLVEVADSGAPFGIPGNQQDDPRFGDIRFFGTSWDPGTLGVSNLPPPINGGTAAGDIILNTDQAWKVGSHYDLETVAIHEIGHALGLDHSAYSDAVMYAYYNDVKQFPTADDVGGIRSIYGVRPQDWIDQFHDNKDPYNAVDISGLIVNRKVTASNLDVTSNQDSDWYYVKAPAGASGTMTITMQSSQLSSLSSRFQVYNSALHAGRLDRGAEPGHRLRLDHLAAVHRRAGRHGRLHQGDGLERPGERLQRRRRLRPAGRLHRRPDADADRQPAEHGRRRAARPGRRLVVPRRAGQLCDRPARLRRPDTAAPRPAGVRAQPRPRDGASLTVPVLAR